VNGRPPLRYEPRRIASLGVRDVDGWRLKVTRVLAPGREPDEALLASALAVAAGVLPAPPEAPEHYGVGVLLVHEGSRYDFVLVGHWVFESELRYQTFMRASSDSARLEALTAGELATDVWDLHVLASERAAWLETVLQPAAAAAEGVSEERRAAYLGRALDETV
jgi:hypothetical protein